MEDIRNAEEQEVIDVSTLEDWMVDRIVEEIKENNAELERYEEIMNKRIEEIKRQFEVKKEQILKQNHYKLTTLREYAMQQESLKQTKTQYKLPLLSGDIIIKKPSKSIRKPNKEKEKKLAELYPEHTVEEKVVKVNWTEIKKNLVEQGGRIYDKTTGEDVTDYVDIVEKEEEVIIK